MDSSLNNSSMILSNNINTGNVSPAIKINRGDFNDPFCAASPNSQQVKSLADGGAKKTLLRKYQQIAEEDMENSPVVMRKKTFSPQIKRTQSESRKDMIVAEPQIVPENFGVSFSSSQECTVQTDTAEMELLSIVEPFSMLNLTGISNQSKPENCEGQVTQVQEQSAETSNASLELQNLSQKESIEQAQLQLEKSQTENFHSSTIFEEGSFESISLNHQQMLKDLKDTLNKQNGKWLSSHVLAVIASDLRFSEAEITASAKQLNEPSPESSVRIGLNEALGDGLDIDIIVTGMKGTRSITNRACLALIQEEDKASRVLSNAQQIISSFASSSLDDNDTLQSSGVVEFYFEPLTGKLNNIKLIPAKVNLHQDNSERLPNIFHQLLASIQQDEELLLWSNEDDVKIGLQFTMIKDLGEESLARVLKQKKADQFGFSNIVSALSVCGFSASDMKMIWRVCAAVLHLGGYANGPQNSFDVSSRLLGLPLQEVGKISNTKELVSRLYDTLYHWIIRKINRKLNQVLSQNFPNNEDNIRLVRLRVIESTATTFIQPSIVEIGDSFSAISVLQSFSSEVSPSASADTIHEMLREGNERFFITSVGDKKSLSLESLGQSGILLFLSRPWGYNKRVLETKFSWGIERDALFQKQLNDCSFGVDKYMIDETQWEKFQIAELKQVLAINERKVNQASHSDGIDLDQSLVEGNERFEALRRQREEQSFDTDTILHLLKRSRGLYARIRSPLLEEIVATLERLQAEDSVEKTAAVLLEGNHTRFPLREALTTLKQASTMQYRSAMVTTLESEAVKHVRLGRLNVDKDAFRAVQEAFQEPGFNIFDNQEVRADIAYMLQFSNKNEDAFDKLKQNTDVRKNIKTKGISMWKAFEPITAQAVALCPSMYSVEAFKSFYLGLTDELQSNLSKRTRFRQNQPRTLPASTSTILQTQQRPKMLFFSKLTPQKRSQPSKENDKFQTEFSKILGNLKGSLDEYGLIFEKKRLCSVFNDLKGQYGSDEPQQQDFLFTVVLDIIEQYDRLQWSDPEGLHLSCSANRLALLAFVLFALADIKIKDRYEMR